VLGELKGGALEFAGEASHAGSGFARILLVFLEDLVDEASVVFL
jgi:hypothetical protein